MTCDCSVGKHPDRVAIEGLIREHMASLRIENTLKDRGRKPIDRGTITHHRRVCMVADAIMSAEALKEGSAKPRGSDDLAVLVQAKAVEGLEAGTLRVTTRDGLNAQALLDRRAEKASDRQFMLTLARLLSGAGGPPPENLIIDVTPTDDTPLLAPAYLRDDPDG